MQLYTIFSPSTVIADTYGNSSYDSDIYNGSAAVSNSNATASSTPSAISPASSLADTGTAIIIFITLACVIIFAALIVRLWRKPKENSSITVE